MLNAIVSSIEMKFAMHNHLGYTNLVYFFSACESKQIVLSLRKRPFLRGFLGYRLLDEIVV